jgi:hypothetical protein
MATELRVRSVQLIGSEELNRWEFPRGVTVIVGDSGGGKTSLLNLIKYGLGGDARVTRDITEAGEGVALQIIAGNRELLLRRSFTTKKTLVAVSEGDLSLGEFSVQNGQPRPWISSLLLEALGIPAIRVPSSRKGKSTRLHALSFQDVFAYCYLDEEEIDQETVNDRKPYGAGSKRPYTFELLHGIIDGDLASLVAEREDLVIETKGRSQRLASVEQFLEQTEVAAGGDQIRRRLAELNSRESEVLELQASAEQQELELATEFSRKSDENERLDADLREAERSLDAGQRELSEVQGARGQLLRDLEAAREGEGARDVLEPLDYVLCPRCEQGLEDRTTATGHCVVCQQPEPAARPLVELGEDQLRGQLAETEGLLVGLRDAVANEEDSLEQLRSEAAERRRALSAAREELLAPVRSRAIALRAELGEIHGEREGLSAVLPIDEAIDREREQIEDHQPRIASLGDQAEVRRRSLEPAKVRIEEVSKTFSEILHQFSLPWLETAEVDRKTYLPVVNGRTLRDLSSGGMKTTTNVAYYLAIFVFGLRDRETLTPSFQMLDSIRKDSGSGSEDLARSDRIYGYLQTLQEMRGGVGSLARDFQLFVVDNDLPAGFGSAFNVLRIDPSSPLVKKPQ